MATHLLGLLLWDFFVCALAISIAVLFPLTDAVMLIAAPEVLLPSHALILVSETTRPSTLIFSLPAEVAVVTSDDGEANH